MNITSIDPHSISKSTLDDWHDLMNAAHMMDSPGDKPLSRAETIGELISDEDRRMTWFSWEGDTLIAGATLSLANYENRHFSKISGCVHPEFRRQGVGTILFQLLRRQAVRENRTILSALLQTESTGFHFLQKYNMTKVLDVGRNVLKMTVVNNDKVEQFASGTERNINDFELIRWIDQCPAELVQAFAKAMDSTNDEPLGKLAWHPVHHTAERIRLQEQGSIRRGQRRYVMCVRHRHTGELLGATDIFVSPDSSIAGVGYTAVSKEYRGRGFAMWLKAAMLRWVMEQAPHITEHETFNVPTNAPMLAVNSKLGYQSAGNWCWLQTSID